MRWFITKFLFSAIRSILSTVTTVVQTRCTQRRLLFLAICKGNGEASNRLANVAVNNYEGSVTNELYDSGVGKLKGVTLLMDHINLGWIFPKGDSICICIHYNKFGVGMNWSIMVLNVDNRKWHHPAVVQSQFVHLVIYHGHLCCGQCNCPITKTLSPELMMDYD